MKDIRNFKSGSCLCKKLLLLAGVAVFVAFIAAIIVKSVKAVRDRYEDDDDFFDDELDLDLCCEDKKHADGECECFAKDGDFEKEL